MPQYRLYCLDQTGKINLAEQIVADSDKEAVAQARTLKPHARVCEIWGEQGLVATLNGHESER